MSNRDQNILLENLEKKVEDLRRQSLVMERNILEKLDTIASAQTVVFTASAWAPLMRIKWWVQPKWERFVQRVKRLFAKKEKKEEVKA